MTGLGRNVCRAESLWEPAASDGFKRQDGLIPAPTARPDSVLLGRDPEALEILIGLHATSAPTILDATYNTGKMWKGCGFQPHTTLDIDPQYGTDVVADFRSMPFEDGSFDVVIFDPPHLPNAYATNDRATGHADVYGVRVQADARSGDNVVPLFVGFLAEANRILRDDGVVLAKISDLVHNHRYQWQMVEFVQAIQVSGLTPCDLLIKRDPAGGNLKSSKWSKVHHLRRVHSYFIVARKGRCERRTA